jgi:hypothetical protein
VIFKARVAVRPDWEEDMEDAEEIVVKVETDEEVSESAKRDVRKKSLETTEPKQQLDQKQSQVHVAASEHDVGEPMDEDTMSDLLMGGIRGTVEGFKTPDRILSAIFIPDSSDSTGWPH